MQCIYHVVIYYICFLNTDKMNEVQTETKRKCCCKNYAIIQQIYNYYFEVLYFLG